jgi:hypothetical protein
MGIQHQARGAPIQEIVGASGPHPAYADKLMLFGRFVGSWDVQHRSILADGTDRKSRGEWHFYWVLEGRAVLDVVIAPPIPERDPSVWKLGDYQMALRFYQPETDTWDMTAITPVHNQVRRLVVRTEGDRIVIEGRAPDGTHTRWSFNDITPNRWRWQGEVSADEGKTWVTDEEMILTRRS